LLYHWDHLGEGAEHCLNVTTFFLLCLGSIFLPQFLCYDLGDDRDIVCRTLVSDEHILYRGGGVTTGAQLGS
jgi:hypothetical protein